MDKGQLYFLIGLARSGKSTISNRWNRFEIDIRDNMIWRRHELQDILLNNQITPRVVICADDFRLVLHGKRFNKTAEKLVHPIVETAVVALLLRGHDVLWDSTNTTLSSIKKMFKIDPGAKCLVMSTDKGQCKARAVATNQEDLLSVIDRMDNNLRTLCGDKDWNKLLVNDAVERIRNDDM